MRHSERTEIVILGDSHVNMLEDSGLSWSEALEFESVKDLGFNGYLSENLINGQFEPLQSAIDLHPKKVVLLIGANDADRGIPVPETMENIRIICNRLETAGAEVILCTVPPVTREYNATIGDHKMQKRVQSLNEKIREFGRENSHEVFDVYLILAAEEVDGEFYLPEALSFDGIHLNKEGYRMFYSALGKLLRG